MNQTIILQNHDLLLFLMWYMTYLYLILIKHVCSVRTSLTHLYVYMQVPFILVKSSSNHNNNNDK